MKKLLVTAFALFFCLGMVEIAGATPFEIGPNGSFGLGGLGAFDYSFTALSSSFDLDEGETSPSLNLFTITFHSFSFGAGTATTSIGLLLPTLTELNDQGSFLGIGGRFFQAGFLAWGAPLIFGYGNGGSLTLDLNDLLGIHSGSSLTISGRITNNHDSAPIPEPATIFLLGTGLIGLAAGFRRKTHEKNSN